MKKLILSSFIFTLFFACNKKNNSESIVKPDFDSIVADTAITVKAIDTQCLQGSNGKDTIILSYEDNLGTITGKILYKKVSNNLKGTFSGFSNGDTLKVQFVQDSATTNEKEMWFLKKNDQLIQATGNYDADGIYFAQPKNVKFNGITLTKTDCKVADKVLK